QNPIIIREREKNLVKTKPIIEIFTTNLTEIKHHCAASNQALNCTNRKIPKSQQ
ncbi:hypothetical protein GIB67_037198, partial [Kingdonia uniflora]